MHFVCDLGCLPHHILKNPDKDKDEADRKRKHEGEEAGKGSGKGDSEATKSWWNYQISQEPPRPGVFKTLPSHSYVMTENGAAGPVVLFEICLFGRGVELTLYLEK